MTNVIKLFSIVDQENCQIYFRKNLKGQVDLKGMLCLARYSKMQLTDTFLLQIHRVFLCVQVFVPGVH